LVKNFEENSIIVNKLKLKSFFYSYSSAVISMSILFIITDYNHEGRFDILYFTYGLLHMIFLGIPAGIIGSLLFKIYTIVKIIIGMTIGPVTAASYLYITLY
jgi:hypothetical protein